MATKNVIKKFIKNGVEYEVYAAGGASGAGDVFGPASATNGHLAVFDGTSGKAIKDGGAVPTGTITGITMNGASKGTSGVVDLGTVITEHQDISGKQDKLVSGTNIKTINSNSILGSGNLDIDGLPSQTGQSGKFLTTNGTTASWDNVPGLQLDANSPITVSKLWVGTEAQYSALSSYSDDTVYMTV